jgi:hypothetical protein
LKAFYEARDSTDEKSVRSYGLDYMDILEKMARSRGDKDLTSHRDRIVNDFHKLRIAEMYVDFKDGSWTEPQPLDMRHVLREIILVKRDLQTLKREVTKIKRVGVEP